MCKLKVRVSTRTRAAQAAPPPSPTPDIGVAEAPLQVPAAAYPQGVQVPVIVNNFINVVGDEAGLASGRRKFLIRQREQRQPAPKRAPRDPAASSSSQHSAQDPPRTATRRERAVENWAALAQAGFFRIVQRWCCRELQKCWESCAKALHHFEHHEWEETRNSDWAELEGLKGSQGKKRLSTKPSQAKGGRGADSSDEDPAKLTR